MASLGPRLALPPSRRELDALAENQTAIERTLTCWDNRSLTYRIEPKSSLRLAIAEGEAVRRASIFRPHRGELTTTLDRDLVALHVS